MSRKSSKSKSNPKAKVRVFEFDEESKSKYPEIIGIMTIGKALILDHYTGAVVQSSYYDDDSVKTIKTLRTALQEHHAIKPEFDIDGFLRSFGRLLIRRIMQEAHEEEKEKAAEQQQGMKYGKGLNG
jgi:hypothetical protein